MKGFKEKQKIKIKFYCLSLLLFSIVVFSQEKINVKQGNQRIESFVDEQGFSQNTVSDITSDSYGNLWIGTPNGLIKYDGYTFEYNYHDTEDSKSIPNNFVANLLNDSQGNLWVDTREGLSVYLPDIEQFFTVSTSTKENAVIKEDLLKRVWVVVDTKLNLYSATKLVNNEIASKILEIELKSFLGNEAIIDIEFLSDSEVLVFTNLNAYKLIIKATGSLSFTCNKLDLDFNQAKINRVLKVNNSIWIATNSGLYQTFYQNNKLITVESFFNSKIDDVNSVYDVRSIFFDNENNLWLGTRNNGVVKYDIHELEFTSYRYSSKNEKGISSNHINCFYEDAFGVIWIGTGQGGLNKLDTDQKPFYSYSHNPYDEHSISGNLITDITEAQDGKIWMSFYGSTICRTQDKLSFDNEQQLSFERLDKYLGKIKDEWVLRLFQDSKGYWWIGTNKGIYLYNEKNHKLKPVQIKKGNEKVNNLSFYHVITQTDSNHILLGGPEVYLLDNPWEKVLYNKPVEVEKTLFELEGENFSVKDFAIDTFGNYWFATINGLYRVVNDGKKFSIKNHLTSTSRNNELTLSHNNVFSILIKEDKSIWLGSFGDGLMKITLNDKGEPKKIKKYHKKDGLPDEVIYGIIEDDKGWLWLSTDMGICHFDTVNEKFYGYDVSDGITSNNFRQGAYLKTKSGIILAGGLKGLTAFDSKKIEVNKIPPKILISRLKTNNQPILTGLEYDGRIILEKQIEDTKEITLNYKNRNISLDLVVQHNSVPQKNKLLYKLEGINKDWIEIDAGKATATYTNLSYGNYKFFYKGANGDGVWTNKTKELLIRVLTPWYLRWWSILFFGVIFLAVIYGVFTYLVSLEKLKQELKFEHIDKRRVQEMNQAKLQFFTNISHDFKTPLSLIIGPLEKISELGKKPENEKYFSIIHNNISRLQRLIDQLISYRQAETGHLELRYIEISLGDFMYPLVEAFEEYASSSSINFYYKINSPNRRIIIDIDKLERVLLNLFSNAIKYGGLNAEVRIEAGFRFENKIEVFYIEVSDTGIGISAENIERIFERFYRGTDYKGNWSGTGIGLSLSRSLIDLMKGSLFVESDPGKKTTFSVILAIEDTLNVEAETGSNKIKRIITDWLPPELEVIKENQTNTEQPSILIVDDEHEILYFLNESLKSKYNIITAKNGEEALKKVNEKLPQLVVSDVMMPKMDGYELCENIKSNLETCHIPVILLTVMGDESKKIKGFELGADVYITKPFSIKHLEVRIKRLIENKQQVFEYFSRNSSMPKQDEHIKIPVRDKEFLEKVNSSIEENMSNSAFGVEELGAILGMSTSSFFRRLKALTGQAPSVYIRNFRLQKAANLLKADVNMNASEVMFQIGIESTSYYSRSFKKLHGYSPSEFVKSLKEKK